MTPREQLICFLSASDESTDPIRIMKGMFLFAQEVQKGTVLADGVFDFRPMSYGPCSPQVYAELDNLVESGRVDATPVAGQTWNQYEATDIGSQEAEQIANREPSNAIVFLQQLREWCDRQSFSSLLKAVYQRYPKFAVNSVFKY